jgi:hypothetical protein
MPQRTRHAVKVRGEDQIGTGKCSTRTIVTARKTPSVSRLAFCRRSYLNATRRDDRFVEGTLE